MIKYYIEFEHINLFYILKLTFELNFYIMFTCLFDASYSIEHRIALDGLKLKYLLKRKSCVVLLYCLSSGALNCLRCDVVHHHIKSTA